MGKRYMVSYELQGKLGLRRVVKVPRFAEQKTDAMPVEQSKVLTFVETSFD